MPRYRHAAALALACLFNGGAVLEAEGPAHLVKDITTAASPFAVYPSIEAVSARRLVFISRGRLWSSDGTAEGTAEIPNAPLPQGFLGSFDGFAYMTASDGAHGRELWRTDGTVEGTRLVADLTPGPVGSSITDLVRFRGELFFGAGTERAFYSFQNALWKTDGTPAGTVRVADSGPTVSLAVLGDRLLFVHGPKSESDRTYALYSTDGTAGGTTLIREFAEHYTDGVCPGSCPTTGPNGFVVMDGVAYFRANDGVTGLELWRTDGTTEGTRLVRDICSPGPCYGLRDSEALRVVGHSLFFFASDPLHGHELWTSDGTAEGTRLVRDLNAGSLDGVPCYFNRCTLEPVAGGVVFPGFDSDVVAGVQLWRSDGSGLGTVPVTLFPPSLYPDRVERVGQDVYFRTYNSNGTAAQLWKTDPSGESVGLIANLESDAVGLTSWNGAVFFAARWHRDSWLWKGDASTPPAPLAILQTAASLASTGFEFLGDAGGRLVFGAASNSGPLQLWSSDGTEAGTRQIADVSVAFSNLPRIAAKLGGNLYFPRYDGSGPPAVWRTDGTPEGTGAVSTIGHVLSSMPCGLSVLGQYLFFGESYSTNLWRSDGVTADVFVPVQTGCGSGGILFPFGGFGFFPGNSLSPDSGLWRTDGTPAGTIRVSTHAARPVAALGSRLFLDVGGTLEVSDGAPGEPVPLSIPSGGLTVVASDSAVFVLTQSYPAPAALWSTDGTPAGTFALGTWDALLAPRGLVTAGSRLFFSAGESEHGQELWTSDGTKEGTQMVLDIAPGPNGSSPNWLTVIDGVLLFAAADERHGTELWRSDGTAAGTFRLQDINPGPDPSYPADFTRAGSLVYFSADDGVHGRELWAIPVAALSPRPSEREREPRVVPSRP